MSKTQMRTKNFARTYQTGLRTEQQQQLAELVQVRHQGEVLEGRGWMTQVPQERGSQHHYFEGKGSMMQLQEMDSQQQVQEEQIEEEIDSATSVP